MPPLLHTQTMTWAGSRQCACRPSCRAPRSEESSSHSNARRLPTHLPTRARSDQYFEGANNSIQHANVNSIISANILSLMEDPGRKFIYVEMAFWTRWWDEQTEAKKADVRGLVARGQLEFINGGWSMHDEVIIFFYFSYLSFFLHLIRIPFSALSSRLAPPSST